MEELRESRRIRLPPHARQRVQIASNYLECQVIPHLQRCRQLMLIKPAEAALALLDAHTGIYKALDEMGRAQTGRPGVEEIQTLSAGNTERSFGAIE